MSVKIIKNKIQNIKSIQKITHAMEMISASKLRKAQEKILNARPYNQALLGIIEHLKSINPDFKHPFLDQRSETKIGIILITSDRGLCGSLNTNLLRHVIGKIKSLDQAGIELNFCAIGQKALSFLTRINAKVLAFEPSLSDKVTMTEVYPAIKNFIQLYIEAKLDKIYLSYNDFISTLKYEPKMELLLPLEQNFHRKQNVDYIYEPSAELLLPILLERYVESCIYQAILENNTAEQSARRLAMNNATDNAEDLIDSFKLKYNNLRQAMITKELAEIVSGAEAV